MMRTKTSGSTIGKVLLLLVLIAAVGGGWYWWSHRNGDNTIWQTIAVGRGDIIQSVTATGTLNPVINVQVGSQISGIIEKLFVDFNSPVKANQVVAQIDAATYQAVVIQAEGDLANARAVLELAQITLKRTRELRARNAAAQATLDQNLAALHQAEAAVKVKEGALARAKVDLDRCTICSPIDGIVISRNVDVGQTVAASLQAPVLFTIANDLTKMQIDANIAEADIGNIEVGQEVEFTVDAFPTRTFRGTVTQVRNAPTTVQNVVSYDAVVSVNNDDLKLKPGMTANATFLVARHDDVLKVGGAAFRFRMPETGGTEGVKTPKPPVRASKPPESRPERTVYRLARNKPELVRIKTGITDGIFVEVIEGLNEGDQVIVGATGSASTPTQTPPSNPLGGGMRRM